MADHKPNSDLCAKWVLFRTGLATHADPLSITPLLSPKQQTWGIAPLFNTAHQLLITAHSRSEQWCRTVPTVTRAIRLEAMFPVSPLRNTS